MIAPSVASALSRESGDCRGSTRAIDPYQSPPRFEKSVGNLSGAISRRINIQHRLVYQVIEE
jgi:plasmid maintenance system killer protein